MKNKFSVVFLALLMITVLGACTPSENNTAPATSTLTSGTTTSQTTTSTITVSGKTVADGTYTENATYMTPEGQENPQFIFTIKSGVVTNVDIGGTPNDRNSRKFQGLFMEGIKPMVVGKKLSDIGPVDAVNGSSLTGSAFNQAVDQLKQQA